MSENRSPHTVPAPGVLAALRRCWIFHDASAEALDELAALCVPRWLEAGTYLFHEGAPPDHLFVIDDGAIEVTRRSPDDTREILLNVLDSGTVGELGLLRGEARSASIRAKRRSLIHQIDGQQFLAFIHRWPDTAVATARTVADGLVRAENQGRATTPPLLWGLLRDSRLPATFPLELARAALPYLKVGGRALVLGTDLAPGPHREGLEVRPRGSGSGTLAEQAQAALREAALVVAVGAPHEMDDIARRAAGFIVYEGAAGPRPGTGARCLELGTRGRPTATRLRLGRSWLELARRVARLLGGHAVGLALGGGGARAIAHLGLIQFVEELGVEVDFVAGTSMGAWIGASWLRLGSDASIDVFRSRPRLWQWLRYLDLRSIPAGVIIPRTVAGAMRELTDDGLIEDLPIPFAAISLDLDSGEEIVASEGPIVDAILASTAIPGIFAPHRYRPPGSTRIRHLVDGAVTNNVPIDTLRAMGADRVIGSHVVRRRDPDRAEKEAAARGWLTDRLLRFPTIDRAITVVKAQLLAIDRNGERSLLAADVPVRIDVSDFGYTEVWRAGELVQAGRRAGEAAASELRLLATGPTLLPEAPRPRPSTAVR